MGGIIHSQLLGVTLQLAEHTCNNIYDFEQKKYVHIRFEAFMAAECNEVL
jgi:hypothetical protein